MLDTMKMAGRSLGHAIWSVCDGEILVPIVGYLKADGAWEMHRLAMGSAQAMATGAQMISNLGENIRGAAFIKDAMITLDTGKTDALVTDIRFADAPNKKVQVILPYRNAKHPDGFAIHRPKVTELREVAPESVTSLIGAFSDGIDLHEQGSKLWKEKYVDQAGVSSSFCGDESTDFSLDEFQTLKRSVFLVFLLVAASDGNVDAKEVKALMKILADPERFGSLLLMRIVTNVITSVPSMITETVTANLDYAEELGRVRAIAEAKLTPEKSREFMIALLRLGHEIAASSGGFLGLGSKVSADEKLALGGIAACLGLVPN